MLRKLALLTIGVLLCVAALELVLRLEKEFGVKIGSSEESRRALASVSELAAFIRARQATT